MRIKVILLFVSMVLSCSYLYSQPTNTQYKKNCVYGEVGGQGMFYSINYERMVTNKISARLGYTNWSLSGFPLGFVTITDFGLWGFPVMVDFLLGDSNRHLELGLGALVGEVHFEAEDMFWGMKVDGYRLFALGTGTFGGRYQPKTGGFLFRIGVTPFFDFEEVMLSGGMSFGFVF